MISIVVTAFNEERYIERAIRSALSQTYTDREVVVVDDGSTDRTLELSRRFLPNLTIIHNDVPTGLMAARNAGVSVARGDVIVFLDGDDELHTEKLRIQYDAFTRLPGPAMLFTGRIVYSEDGVARIPLRGDCSGKLREFELTDVLLKTATSLGATLMMAKKDYVSLGGMDVAVGKERDFIARFAYTGGRLFRLCLPLYIQHRKPGSMSTQTLAAYHRELAMLDAWRPSATRHPSRAISESLYSDYAKSVTVNYRRRFARDIRNASLAGVTSTWPIRISRYLGHLFRSVFLSWAGRLRYVRCRLISTIDLAAEDKDRPPC